jgi:hypothetical protein
MKTRTYIIVFCIMLLLNTACQKDVLDTPFITIKTPNANQIFGNNAPINVVASIDVPNAKVVSHQVTARFANKNLLYTSNGGTCIGENLVQIDQTFINTMDKNANMTLEITATLDNGSTITKSLPFKITE